MKNSNKSNQLVFLNEYFNNYRYLLEPDDSLLNDLIYFTDLLKKIHASGNKAIIVGNGVSSAIDSHFSVDLTKNASVRYINFNEADLITCFAND